MIRLLKKLLVRTETKREEDLPGRTFKRILTGEYFGLQDTNASKEAIEAAKKDKIDKIKSLHLSPKFIRYISKKSFVNNHTPEVKAAHVVFQNEIYDEKWHMVHVTEVSFIVPKEEFSEFEEMAGVTLSKDFRDLTEYPGKPKYQGVERRRVSRPAAFA
jgi:hypothetical protein